MPRHLSLRTEGPMQQLRSSDFFTFPLSAPFYTTAHPHNSALRSECSTAFRPSVCGVGTQSFNFVARRGKHPFKSTKPKEGRTIERHAQAAVILASSAH